MSVVNFNRARFFSVHYFTEEYENRKYHYCSSLTGIKPCITFLETLREQVFGPHIDDKSSVRNILEMWMEHGIVSHSQPNNMIGTPCC